LKREIHQQPAIAHGADMASIAAAAAARRASLRLARSQIARHVTRRGFRTSAATLAAQNFTMPALSPTMTEGNIAKWQIKEGEKFSAGDVLLEIETDKATMDVEAQEDGVLMRIMQGDGTKGIQVGTRIAVIAEEGDDISSLEIPADENPQPKAASQPAKSEQPPAPAADFEPAASSSTPAEAKSQSSGKAPKRKYPMLPSVLHLLKENGLDESAISEVKPTGPNGRILKGDVLAFLGKIDTKTPSAVSSRFEKNAHLDLSNIKLAKAPEPKKAEKAAAPVPEKPKTATVEVSVSVEAVKTLQEEIAENLGTDMPLATFIVRAADLANERLPVANVSQDRLFNEVLGIYDERDHFSRGAYAPDISPVRVISTAHKRQTEADDIFDLLCSHSKSAPKPKAPVQPTITGPAMALSLTVPSEQTKRATVFLERMKSILEEEPNRLVL